MFAAAALLLLASDPAAFDPLGALIELDRGVAGEALSASGPGVPLRLALMQVPGLWERGDFLGAATLLQHAAGEPLLDPVGQLLEAESLAYGGRAAAAAPAFARLAQSGDLAVAQLAARRLAETELVLGRSTDAVAELQTLLKKSDSAVLELDLGRAAAGSEVGEAALRRAYLLDPEGEVGAEASRLLPQDRSLLAGLSAREVLAYAQRLLRGGHPEEALAAVSTASRAEQSGELEVCAAQCERALGHPDAARAHLSRAAQLADPRAAALARIALARVKESEGNLQGALALLGQVAKARVRAPEGSEALYLAAWMAMDHGDSQDGFKLFGQLAARRKDKHAGEARWWTGWAEELIGKPAAALAAWRPLLTPLTPGPLGPQALYWSAHAHEELGEKAEAQALRRSLQAVAPLSYYALLDRGGVPSEAASSVLPQCLAPTLSGTEELSLSVRRGELLWALGLSGLARAELDVADQQAHGPVDAAAVAEVETALGEPGRAFNLVQARGGGCFVGSLLAPQLFPRPYRNQVERAAEVVQIDPIWIWAIMRQESRFERRARSQALAGGAMQLLATTSQRIASVAGTPSIDREDSTEAIETAAWYLRALSDRFGGDLALVAAAYNAGPASVASWINAQGQRRLDTFVEQIPFRETRQYVKAVVANAAAYRALFGPPGQLLDPAAPPKPAQASGVAF